MHSESASDILPTSSFPSTQSIFSSDAARFQNRSVGLERPFSTHPGALSRLLPRVLQMRRPAGCRKTGDLLKATEVETKSTDIPNIEHGELELHAGLSKGRRGEMFLY